MTDKARFAFPAPPKPPVRVVEAASANASARLEAAEFAAEQAAAAAASAAASMEGTLAAIADDTPDVQPVNDVVSLASDYALPPPPIVEMPDFAAELAAGSAAAALPPVPIVEMPDFAAEIAAGSAAAAVAEAVFTETTDDGAGGAAAVDDDILAMDHGLNAGASVFVPAHSSHEPPWQSEEKSHRRDKSHHKSHKSDHSERHKSHKSDHKSHKSDHKSHRHKSKRHSSSHRHSNRDSSSESSSETSEETAARRRARREARHEARAAAIVNREPRDARRDREQGARRRARNHGSRSRSRSNEHAPAVPTSGGDKLDVQSSINPLDGKVTTVTMVDHGATGVKVQEIRHGANYVVRSQDIWGTLREDLPLPDDGAYQRIVSGAEAMREAARAEVEEAAKAKAAEDDPAAALAAGLPIRYGSSISGNVAEQNRPEYDVLNPHAKDPIAAAMEKHAAKRAKPVTDKDPILNISVSPWHDARTKKGKHNFVEQEKLAFREGEKRPDMRPTPALEQSRIFQLAASFSKGGGGEKRKRERDDSRAVAETVALDVLRDDDEERPARQTMQRREGRPTDRSYTRSGAGDSVSTDGRDHSVGDHPVGFWAGSSWRHGERAGPMRTLKPKDRFGWKRDDGKLRPGGVSKSFKDASEKDRWEKHEPT